MTIDRIGQYGGLYQNYKIPEIKSENIQKVKEQEEVKQNPIDRRNEYTDTNRENENKQSKNADLEDISLTFNKEDTFDYLGKDSEIAGLDMQKAVSDMRRDRILEGYQYFVGSTENLFQNNGTQDGIVIQKG